jgi:NAD(P)-dependent dehydrogenase (short-subunit alcohol dehydrogenase family)
MGAVHTRGLERDEFSTCRAARTPLTRRRSRSRSNGESQALAVDVASESSAKDAIAGVVAAYGKLTTLVNVAATVTAAIPGMCRGACRATRSR